MVIRKCVAVLVLLHPNLLVAAEPTFFRQDFGIADAQSPPLQVDDSTTLWKVSVDRGHSTPVVVDDLILLTTFDDATQQHATVALDRATGEQRWQRKVRTERFEPQHTIGSPASATVATDGERVYSFFGNFGLLCYQLDGTPVWRKPLGPFQDEFGSSSSPILVGGRLILCEDHDVDSFLLAVDAKSGDTLWQAPRELATRSYATPTIWQHDDKTEIIVAGALELASYDFDTGEKLWWVRGLARIVNPTPVVLDDQIIVSTWSPGGDPGERIQMQPWAAATAELDANNDSQITKDELQPGAVLTRFYRIDLDQNEGLDQTEWERHASVFSAAKNQTLAIRPGGTGDLTETAVLWKNETGAPYVSSPLVHDGVVYLVKDGGILTSLDANTGEMLKRGRLRGRGNYYASPVIADGKIYIASQQGVLTIVSAGRDWGIVTSHDFGEGLYATPVFDNDQLLIRTEHNVYCLQTPKP